MNMRKNKNIAPLTIYERLRNAEIDEKAALEIAKILCEIMETFFEEKKDITGNTESEQREKYL